MASKVLSTSLIGLPELSWLIVLLVAVGCASSVSANPDTDLSSAAEVSVVKSPTSWASVALGTKRIRLTTKSAASSTWPPEIVQSVEELKATNLIIDSSFVGRLKGMPKLRAIDLSGSSGITPATITDLLKSDTLRVLSLAECDELTNECLRQIAKSKIQELDISWCEEISDEGVSHLAASAHLGAVNLSGVSISHFPVPRDIPSPWPRLARLNISDTDLDDSALARIFELASLVEFSANNCLQLTAKGLIKVASSSIERLEVEGTAVDDTVLAVWAKLPSLKSLSVAHNSELGEVGLRQLDKCKKLRELSLAGCNGAEASILKDLAVIDQLEIIALDELSLDIAVCRRLGESSCLRRLTVTRSAVADDGLEQIARCESLECLNASHNDRITDAGLDMLAKAKSLMDLSLAGCTQLSSNALSRLCRARGLRLLNLSELNGVDDDVLKTIKEQGSIEILILRRCGKLSPAGVAGLSELNTIRALDLTGCRQLASEIGGWAGRLNSLRVLSLLSISIEPAAAKTVDMVLPNTWVKMDE